MITLFFYQTIINLPRLKGDQINILLIGVCHPIKELKKERLFQNIKKIKNDSSDNKTCYYFDYIVTDQVCPTKS